MAVDGETAGGWLCRGGSQATHRGFYQQLPDCTDREAGRELSWASTGWHACLCAGWRIRGAKRCIKHAISEEEFAVHGHHHDANFVGEFFRNDFLNEQRIAAQGSCFELQTLGLGSTRDAYAVRVSFRKKLLALLFGLTVDDLGLRFRLRVFQRGFLACFGFE